MEYKNLRFEIKNLDEKGTFEGYAAVKGNVDSYGDIIENGAFERTLAENKTFPILFMHDPAKPVGLSMLMKEDPHGLYTCGQIDLDTELGRTVYSGLKKKYIDSMSIGYTVLKDDMNKKGNRLLKEIKLIEYSLITKGFAANELALVSGFKSSTMDFDFLDQRIRKLEYISNQNDGEGKNMDHWDVPGLEEDMKRLKNEHHHLKRMHEELRDDHEEHKRRHDHLKRKHMKLEDDVRLLKRKMDHLDDYDDDYDDEYIEHVYEVEPMRRRGKSLFF